MVCSRARSASDRTTACRLRTSASYIGGIPGPHEHETEPHIPQVTTDELLAAQAELPHERDQVVEEVLLHDLPIVPAHGRSSPLRSLPALK
jgi:hypothetical protein